MEWTATGVLTQALGSLRGQLSVGDHGGELLHLVGGEAAQPKDGTALTGGEPDQTLRQITDVVLSGDEQHQHPIRVQAPHREEKGEQRGPVGPLCVVDDHRDRARAREVAEKFDEVGSDDRGLGAPSRGPRCEHRESLRQGDARRAGELLDDPVGQGLLLLHAAASEDPQIVGSVKEASNERALADTGGSGQENVSRVACPHLVEPRPQQAEFLLPADEGPPVMSVQTTALLGSLSVLSS